MVAGWCGSTDYSGARVSSTAEICRVAGVPHYLCGTRNMPAIPHHEGKFLGLLHLLPQSLLGLLANPEAEKMFLLR